MAKRGGKRQGTPGRAYANRQDLANNYRSQDVTATAAAGPFSQAPSPNSAAPTNPSPAPTQPPAANWMTPDDVPSLQDPTMMPDQDPTTGLGEAMPTPAPQYLNKLYAAYNLNPTPELRQALNYLSSMGQ
jgi:hypothetical protein